MDGILMTTETQRFLESTNICSLLTLGNLEKADIEEVHDEERIMAGALRKDVLAIHARAVAKCNCNEKGIRDGKIAWAPGSRGQAVPPPADTGKGVSKKEPAVPSSNRGKTGITPR